MEAVLYRYRAGIPWRDLPERFGNPIRSIAFLALGQIRRLGAGVPASRSGPNNEYAMIDSTIGAPRHRRAPKKDGEDQAMGARAAD